LCRALAQKASNLHNCYAFRRELLTGLKLSIRLGDLFHKATLVEVNANAMLSKYFGESGKLIESTFDQVEAMAKDRSKLVVVVIDEVETIASSRQRVSSSGECNDGLRVSIHWLSNPLKHYHVGATADRSTQATNQLLTALDRIRSLTNILVCCTSNLIEAIVSCGFAQFLLSLLIIHANSRCRIPPSLTMLTSNNMCLLHRQQRFTTSFAAA
jgi:SpoVK/Ycf46/Vps4 family AAA+-type ATPase